jgi:Xaa-Pro aminopeptidase
LCGDGRPTGAQADIFARAEHMIEANLDLFRPGAGFREVTEAYVYPALDEFHAYTVLAHGVGLCDEYPSIFVREQWETTGYDGVFEAGNVVCVEAFVGRRTGGEGVKLEQQIAITETGYELLTNAPMKL